MSEPAILPRKGSTSSAALFDTFSPIHNYINGRFVASSSKESQPVTNPSNGETIARVPLSGSHDVDDAARAATAAFSSWSATPIKERAQVFYRYKTLMEKNLQELGALVNKENGKVRKSVV